MVLPTFLGVGASRSGTTSLWDFMRRHPQIYVPSRKELHFFTYNRGRHSLQDYESFFAPGARWKCRGEISPSYLWFPDAAKLIKSVVFPANIVIVLRNPVERALSDFQYGRGNGQIGNIDCASYIEAGIEWRRTGQLVLTPFHPSSVLWKGFYDEQIPPYLAEFGDQNVKLFLFDDLVRDFPAVRSELCAFLGVEDEPVELEKKNSGSWSIQVPAEVRKRLADFYADSIRACAQLLGRDLDHWLELD